MDNFAELLGKTLIAVDVGKDNDEIYWSCSDGEEFKSYHEQDCCERVTIDDIIGDLTDLVGSPIIKAEERTSDGDTEDEYDDSATWTFYEIATIKGSVTIRWYGSSNGYYSERVDFLKKRNGCFDRGACYPT